VLYQKYQYITRQIDTITSHFAPVTFYRFFGFLSAILGRLVVGLIPFNERNQGYQNKLHTNEITVNRLKLT